MFRAISSFFSSIGETISSGFSWLRDRFKGGGREEEEEDEEEEDEEEEDEEEEDEEEEDEEEEDDVYLGDGDDDVGEVENIEQKNLRGPFMTRDDVGEVENIEPKNLRGPFMTRDDAEEYASDIPVPTFIIYDEEDDLWYVVIDY